MAADDLLKALQLQAEASRELEAEQREASNAKAAYANSSGKTASGNSYTQIGDASIPQGTSLAGNFDPSVGEVVWVETWDTGQSGSVLAEKIQCANGTDCLYSDVCYGYYECNPCDWCENNECVPRDENRPCGEDWECPCPPNENQHYVCANTKCTLTCNNNEDCGECEVCDLVYGLCVAGCEQDSDCDPKNPNRAGDAQADTFCEQCECVYPCVATRCCKADSDCGDGEYCGEKEFRVASDPDNCLKECLQGCYKGGCKDTQGEQNILFLKDQIRDETDPASLVQLREELEKLRAEVLEYNSRAECDEETRECYIPCSFSSECKNEEICEDGKCIGVGSTCRISNDCSEGEYCDNDGRCQSGCESDSDCIRTCGKVLSCVDACPPASDCTCEGEGCYNPNWIDECPRNAACVNACPDDESCAKSNRKSSCENNRCEEKCIDSSDCDDGYICTDGVCMNKDDSSEEFDSRLGCGCGDVCNTSGTCEPAICIADEDCPAGGICEDGVCACGCSDENPCPDGGCCNPDGRCAKKCRTDLDCVGEEGNQLCLEGGCCGLICDPLVPCSSDEGCQPGQYCGDENYCLDGCINGSQCNALIEPGSPVLMKCEKNFVMAPNGVLAPCSFYPNEECFSEVGQCVEFCISDSNCIDGQLCEDGTCKDPVATCRNDKDCESDQICKDLVCTSGCRFNSDCEDGEKCFENSCAPSCNNDTVCKALYGKSGYCNDNKICDQVNSDTGGGHKGCECYEFCDENGFCTPYVCDSDLDCEDEACGSCLVGNVCGECIFDSECPGVKVCDNKDDRGILKREPLEGRELVRYQALQAELAKQIAAKAPHSFLEAISAQLHEMMADQPYIKGSCAYPCTPGGPGICKGTRDCDKGFYCNFGQCERGCSENADCMSYQVCRNEQCVNKCNVDIENCADDDDCELGGTCRNGKCTTCAENHICIEGGCQFVGSPCDSENDEAKNIESQLEFYERREGPNKNDQLKIEQLILQKRTIEVAGGPDAAQYILEINNVIAAIQQQYTPLTDLEESQREVLQAQLTIAKNKDCDQYQECVGQFCEPIPQDCLADFECTYPEVCAPLGPQGRNICYEPPTNEDYRVYEPQVIGCPSCADTCTMGGICKPTPCRTTEDCPCGFCGGAGICIETCRTSFDCGGGRCIAGECVECTSNGDCVEEYGTGAVCNEGKCDTPCYTGLSSGDCFQGLSDGDTCHNCPDQCPLGSPCRKVNEVCNVEEVYDVLEGRTKALITNCTVCARTCITSTDCEEGTICGGFGYCRQTDGRCTFDSDCAEEALQSGLDLHCSNNTCIELGTTCFTNSDCLNDEVCSDGKCVEGDCGSDNSCQSGQTCVDNKCVWQCGAGSEIFLCGDGGNCPPGYYCSAESTIGGYCLRPGVTLSTVTAPECAVGEICCDGGCVAINYGSKQCCSAEHCPGEMQCCDGMCKSDCSNNTSTEPGSTETDGVAEQDNCELIGKCCGANGFCEPCGCDEFNPCEEGQCCDRGSGQCMGLSIHPNTKYGSPSGCTIDPVFCELYDSPESDEDEPSQIIPEELGDERLYRGCEVVDALTQEVRCVEGGKKNIDQIRNLLRDACFAGIETKECNCDEIPDTDECVTDDDCGPCADCIEKTYKSDACCGIYGEGEITSSTGFPIPTEVDFITRKICKSDDYNGEKTAEECGCRSDADCTECEYCDGGGVNELGVCTEDCETRCPCGGPLANDKKCKTCQERYGPCAKDGSFEQGEEYIDPITGDLTVPPSQCACILDRTKECCQGFNSFEELKYQKTKCLQATQALVDGTIAITRTDKCIDPKKDICAQCITDAQCVGNQKCKGYKCISECGSANSDPNDIGAADTQEPGEIGGNPYLCWCCSEQGECRSRYETWIESKADAKGPWNFEYYLNSDPDTRRYYYSAQTKYDDAVREVKNSWPKNTLTIVKADGEEQSGDCRPCNCTETGIQCGAWADCDSCFKWEKRGEGIDIGPKAEVMRVEAKIQTVNTRLEQLQETLNFKIIDLENAAAAARSAITQTAINHALNTSVQEQLTENRNEYNAEIDETNGELLAANEKVTQIEKDIELAEFNQKLLDKENLEAQLPLAQAEADALQARSDELKELKEENIRDIFDLTENLPSDVQIDLENKQNNLIAAENVVGDVRYAITREQQNLRFLQHDLAAVENPSSVYYEQVRVCDCCMGGVCRADSECTYGTCYACVTEYDNTPGMAYNAQLYGKVLKNIISPDSPDRTGEEEMNGRFRFDYYVEKDSCVKYDCEQTLYSEERGGVTTQGRYWEVCLGSLLGCINEYWEGKKYRQGWVYDIDLSEAGTYFTTDFEHWVKMGHYQTYAQPPNKWPVRSECLHDNSAAGALGFNTMVTFEDLVAGHPICNKAEMIFGCTPGNEGCGATYDTYFESGAPDLIIAKMRQELLEMGALLQWIEGYIEFVDDFIKDQEDEIETLETRERELEIDIDKAHDQLHESENEVRRLESLFKDTDTDRKDIDDEYEAARDNWDTINDDLTDLEGIETEKTDQRSEQVFLNQNSENNLKSAQALANTLFREVEFLRISIAQNETLLTTTDPLSTEYAELQITITNQNEELEEKQETYANAVGDMISYEEEIKFGTRLLEVNSCELPEDYTDAQFKLKGYGSCRSYEDQLTIANQDVENFRTQFIDAEIRLRVAEQAQYQWVDDREKIFTDLQGAKSVMENDRATYEDLNKRVGVEFWDVDKCKDGYENSFLKKDKDGELKTPICCKIREDGTKNCSTGVRIEPGDWNRECKDICEEIKNRETNIENADAQKSELETLQSNTETAYDEKNKEIEALIEKDENETPPWAVGPLPRPDGSKNIDELLEQLEENIEINEYLEDKKPWPPGRV